MQAAKEEGWQAYISILYYTGTWLPFTGTMYTDVSQYQCLLKRVKYGTIIAQISTNIPVDACKARKG